MKNSYWVALIMVVIIFALAFYTKPDLPLPSDILVECNDYNNNCAIAGLYCSEQDGVCKTMDECFKDEEPFVEDGFCKVLMEDS